MSAAAVNPASAARPSEPYRGIEEFRFIDAPIFFGREDDASALLRLVTIYRGVLLFGDSGAGKSSLINAGLMPMAVADGFAPERIRVQPVAGAEFGIERIAPAEDLKYLPSIFTDDSASRRVGVSASEFRQRIEENCGGQGSRARSLLVFDQFEELVTLSEQKRLSANGVPVYDTITKTLLELLRDDTLSVKLLFVFREDHYAKLSKFFALYPNLSNHALRLEPLQVGALRTVIEGPFRSSVVRFDRSLPETVIDGLVQAFTERSESDSLNLTEVQIACLSLWHDDDPEARLATSGVSGILEAYFTNAIKTVPARLLDPAVVLLTRMITSSNTRNVVSFDDLIGDLAEKEKIDSAIATEALGALERTRIVRRSPRSKVVVYEIVSEYLVPWIRAKKAEAQAARVRRAHDERRERSWRTMMIVSTIVFLLLLAGLMIEVYRRSSTRTALQLRSEMAEHRRSRNEIQHLRAEVEGLTRKLVETTTSIDKERQGRTSAEQTAIKLRSDLEWAVRRKEDAAAEARLAETQREALKKLVDLSGGGPVPLSMAARVLNELKIEEFERVTRNYQKDLDALSKQLEAAQIRIKELQGAARLKAP